MRLRAFFQLGACAALGLLAIPSEAPAQLDVTPFAKYQRDLQNSGFAPGIPPAPDPGLKPKWTTQLANAPATEVRSSPAVSADGSTLYIGSNTGVLYALDAETGGINWQLALDTAGGLFLNTPAIGNGGQIYIGTWAGDKRFYCVEDNGASGAVVWQYTQPGNCLGSPAVLEDGSVVFTTADAPRVVRLDSGGNLMWEADPMNAANGGIGSSVAVSHDGARLYVQASETNAVYCLDVGNGAVLGTISTPSWNWAPSPVVGPDGTIYVGGSYSDVIALTDDGAGTLTEKWRIPFGTMHNGGIGAVRVVGGVTRLYTFANFWDELAAIDDMGDHAEIRWTLTLGVGGWGYQTVVALDDGTLYVPRVMGPIIPGPGGGREPPKLYAIRDDGNSATVLWEYEVGGDEGTKAVSVNYDGTVYHIDHSGVVHALNAPGVVPRDVSVIRGLLLSGGLLQILGSDDSRLVVRTAVFAPSLEPPVQIEVVGTSPTESPSELRFRFEGMASRNLIERRISLYNYVTQSYEELH
ncbi:MAG: PQQ-like beta-propeller repeat protein, partial [Armatimonadetes bacterium]|nr:PQQ-like beta-propeller repeat protein [Armatimonadota bacterium]